MDEIVGYVDCHRCGGKELRHVAWQTGGLCFECFQRNDLTRLRELVVAQNADRHTIKRQGGNKKSKTPKRGPNNTNQKADLARLRALRRMRHMFPEVFDVLYAEERWKAGLVPRPKIKKNYLVDAVATYERYASYDASSDRSE